MMGILSCHFLCWVFHAGRHPHSAHVWLLCVALLLYKHAHCLVQYTISQKQFCGASRLQPHPSFRAETLADLGTNADSATDPSSTWILTCALTSVGSTLTVLNTINDRAIKIRAMFIFAALSRQSLGTNADS